MSTNTVISNIHQFPPNVTMAIILTAVAYISVPLNNTIKSLLSHTGEKQKSANVMRIHVIAYNLANIMTGPKKHDPDNTDMLQLS